ncbi:DUF6037 family protein [Vibrio sp. Vb2133]|uniref:DUF6037 family protein n=1 Tax=unclassified Vibrio TaxID=2614977 RepID=UPI002964810D|nr:MULTISPECIES: DUF6037 family protein [unclassified Vibrio]MDW1751178.1 DUF6037 family protein [Vibrio sp. Vb2133]MDW1793607.1 DUF6037 family protein [Vibrio sp. Vb2132]MDW3149440.1 DUF6037 family protein [Vibrio sp. 2132-1]
MSSLKHLHQSMLEIDVDIQQFQVTVGIATFDCLFSTRESPFVLALTSRGLNPKFFKFEVTKGYWIKEYFGDMFGDLLEVLKGGGHTNIALKPAPFLEQLNKQLPVTAYKEQVPSTAKVLELRSDITEERDRPYFDAWIYWKDKKYKNVPSAENQAKTLALIGKEALEYSKAMKASSKWSTTDLNRDWKS